MNVGFRLAPEDPFPAALDDCWAAVRWAAANAASFGGDPDRLAVGGDASGGTYAAVCALRAKEAGAPALRLQVLLSPCTEFAEKYPSRVEFADDPMIPAEMIEALMDAYAPDSVDRTDWQVSPVRHPDPSGVAPAYILASEYDFLRDEERAFAERLADADVPVDFVCWPGTVHNFFSMYDHVTVARTAMGEAAAALRARVRAARPSAGDAPRSRRRPAPWTAERGVAWRARPPSRHRRGWRQRPLVVVDRLLHRSLVHEQLAEQEPECVDVQRRDQPGQQAAPAHLHDQLVEA